jgi:hypothetical protein
MKIPTKTTGLFLGALMAATPARADDTVDLSALGVHDESQSAKDDERPLQLYGFADVTYYQPFFPRDSFLAAQIPENPQFVMGNFNLYLAKQVSRSAPRARRGALHVPPERADVGRAVRLDVRGRSGQPLPARALGRDRDRAPARRVRPASRA